MSLAVYFALTPRFLLLDFAGPAEAFRLAGELGAAVTLTVCGARPELACSLGPTLGGLAPLPDSLPEGALVLATGTTKSIVDYTLPEAGAVVDWLRTVAAPTPGATVASVCSAAFLLGRAGLLDGRRCTTHHSLIERLRREAPRALVEENRIYVDDRGGADGRGAVLTSAGITTGIDLALHLIERHCGAEMASRVAREMVVYLRRAGHDPQLSPWLAFRNHLHPAVHRAQDAIARDPARRWSVDELADVAHVSPRHLTRLFAQHAGVGVVEYQQRLRLARVRELRADGISHMERLAEMAGFGSARDLRRVWARLGGDDLPRP